MSNGIGLEDLSQGTRWWGGKGYGIGDKISGVVISAERAQQRDFDTGTPMKPSGIRIGTPAVTTRGMKEKDV